MKITVEHDDGKVEVFQEVTDAYVAVRQYTPTMNKQNDIALLPETKSYSWGSNVRELLKELRQSVVELQEFIHAHTS
jgi:hypothetical protein